VASREKLVEKYETMQLRYEAEAEDLWYKRARKFAKKNGLTMEEVFSVQEDYNGGIF
jgi:hypothetical protein